MYSSKNAFKNLTSVLFISGLGVASVSAIGLDYFGSGFVVAGNNSIPKTIELNLSPIDPRPYSENDIYMAETAWAYIENNTQKATGWVNSVDGFPSTTLWDQGSYILGLVSAVRIGIIADNEFDKRVTQFLTGLSIVELFDGKLPNKTYNTNTLGLVDYKNKPTEKGIGWSAIDIGRMLSALRILEHHYPSYAPTIRQILSNWDLQGMVKSGELVGTAVVDGETVFNQEGRIGYEQYAARAAALWGLDTINSVSARDILKWEKVQNTEVPADNRSHRIFNAVTPTLSEPYILQGLELGLDSEAARLAERVYQAQVRRFEETGQLTFVSEDHIDQAPYFVYSTVYGNENPWSVLSEAGNSYDHLRTLSTKTVFGWDALYETNYTALGLDKISQNASFPNGWAAGIYEQDDDINGAMTLNTNGIVLEAIHYKIFGPLWSVEN